jgi:ferritin-like protein
VASDNRRRDGISRRKLLLGVGAGAGVVLLDACGSAKPPAARNPEVNGVDADLLDEVFMLENMSIAAYTHAAASLQGPSRTLGRTIGAQEIQHALKMAPVIHALGGQPTPELKTYGFPVLADDQAALAFVGGVENTLIAAYIDVVPKITSVAARAFAVSIMTNHAQHLALVTQARGLSPTAQAIVRGAG